jgi:hypothetical protein
MLLGYLPGYDAKRQHRKHYKGAYLYGECGAQPYPTAGPKLSGR